jgi:hypothetical protein
LNTSLRPVKRNATRRTGVPAMYDRLERLLPSLHNATDDILQLLPSPTKVMKIRDQKQALADFKSVTLALQSNTMSLKDSEALFVSITRSYPMFDFGSYIGLGANIVHAKDLESALIKIQVKTEDSLSFPEQRAVERLLIHASQPVEGKNDVELSFAERELKRQRQAELKSSTRCIDTRFVLPTSNLAERLFSQAKRVYNPHRRSLHPRTLQALLSLNQNRSLWNLPIFAKIVN